MSLAPPGGGGIRPKPPYNPQGYAGSAQWLPPPIPAAEQGQSGPWFQPIGPYKPPVYPTTTQATPPKAAAPTTVAPPPTVPQSQWADAIKKDPLYVLAQQQAEAARQAAIQGLRAAQQRALIQYGGVPTLPNGLGFDLTNALDPTTRSLIQQNTAAHLSTESQIADQYQQGYSSAINNLAARGLLHSGETGNQLNLLQRGRQQAEYGATQQLLDALTGQWGGYAQSEAQRQNDVLAAMNAAVSRLLQYPDLNPGPVMAPTYFDSQAFQQQAQKQFPWTAPPGSGVGLSGGYTWSGTSTPRYPTPLKESGGRRGGV